MARTKQNLDQILNLVDGKALASPKGYIRIGNVLIQWVSTSVTLTASGSINSWSANWPIAFNTLEATFADKKSGWIYSVSGGIEANSLTGASGYYTSNTGTFPRSITIYVFGIGT